MKYNLSTMMCLDIYLSFLSKKEYEKIKQDIKPKNAVVKPLICYDIFNLQYFNTIDKLKIESDIEIVKTFAKKSKLEK